MTTNFASVRGDATFDTRVDPLMPRNAVLLTAAIEHLAFTSGSAVDRTELDASGYLGFIRSIGGCSCTSRALAPIVRCRRTSWPLLGGWSSLRGAFKRARSWATWSSGDRPNCARAVDALGGHAFPRAWASARFVDVRIGV